MLVEVEQFREILDDREKARALLMLGTAKLDHRRFLAIGLHGVDVLADFANQTRLAQSGVADQQTTCPMSSIVCAQRSLRTLNSVSLPMSGVRLPGSTSSYRDCATPLP